jgi:hypothetical protein
MLHTTTRPASNVFKTELGFKRDRQVTVSEPAAKVSGLLSLARFKRGFPSGLPFAAPVSIRPSDRRKDVESQLYMRTIN